MANQPQPQQPAEEANLEVRQDGRQPPGGGRQDHYAMRADSMIHVTGPAGTETLAVGGGLEIPGREPSSTDVRVADLDTVSPVPEIIPGAYEADTATPRDAGAIGGRFNGADQQPVAEGTLADERVREEWRRIGGKKGS